MDDAEIKQLATVVREQCYRGIQSSGVDDASANIAIGIAVAGAFIAEATVAQCVPLTTFYTLAEAVDNLPNKQDALFDTACANVRSMAKTIIKGQRKE